MNALLALLADGGAVSQPIPVEGLAIGTFILVALCLMGFIALRSPASNG